MQLSETLKKYISETENPQVWTNVFTALANYETEKMQEISKVVEQQHFLHWKKVWNVQVGLLEMKDKTKEQALPKELQFISSFDKSPLYAYLDCPYEKMNEWFQQEFHGYYRTEDGKKIPFAYQLVQEMQFSSEEKELCKFAEFNNLEIPLIYSPLFRRLVKIDFSQELTEKELATIDLQLDNYPELKKVLRLNHRAVWNVRFTDMTVSNTKILEETSQKTPTRYCHSYGTEPNEYIYFDIDSPYQYEILKSDKKIEIYTNDSNLENVNRLEIVPLDTSSLSIAWNLYTFDMSRPLPPRIRTKADIYDVISRLKFEEGSSLELSEILTTESNSNQSYVFCEYSRSEQYPQHQDPLFNQSANTIRLIFEKEETTYFYDKIVMILHYLRQHYPEFYWKGGYQR